MATESPKRRAGTADSLGCGAIGAAVLDAAAGVAAPGAGVAAPAAGVAAPAAGVAAPAAGVAAPAAGVAAPAAGVAAPAAGVAAPATGVAAPAAGVAAPAAGAPAPEPPAFDGPAARIVLPGAAAPPPLQAAGSTARSRSEKRVTPRGVRIRRVSFEWSEASRRIGWVDRVYHTHSINVIHGTVGAYATKGSV